MGDKSVQQVMLEQMADGSATSTTRGRRSLDTVAHINTPQSMHDVDGGWLGSPRSATFW
jgi:hypothetical protein